MKKIFFFFTTIIILIMGCQKFNFSAKDFLLDFYNYKIEPDLKNAETVSSNLVNAFSSISIGSSSTDLENFRTSFKYFLNDIEDIRFYNIGDINVIYVYNRIYKSKIDIDKILAFYNSNTTFDVSNISNTTSNMKGVTTIEYLLFNEFAMDSMQNSTKYLSFIDAQLKTVKIEISHTKSSWNIYKDNFIGKLDDGTKGSYNMIVNQIIHGLEEVTIKKIGKPVKDTENYSKTRLNTIKQNIQQRYDVFMGNGTQEFNSVFTHLRKKDKDLAKEVQLDFEKLIQIGSGLTENYSYYYNNDPAKLKDFRKQIQELIFKLKIEVVYALNVTLTLSDSDGD